MFKFMKFLLKVDKNIKKHFSPRWKGKGCHGNDNENGATAAFRFRYSIEIPMQRGSVRNVTCRDGGVISNTEFPHVGGKAKRGATCIDNSSMEQARASHTTHNIRSRA